MRLVSMEPRDSSTRTIQRSLRFGPDSTEKNRRIGPFLVSRSWIQRILQPRGKERRERVRRALGTVPAKEIAVSRSAKMPRELWPPPPPSNATPRLHPAPGLLPDSLNIKSRGRRRRGSLVVRFFGWTRVSGIFKFGAFTVRWENVGRRMKVFLGVLYPFTRCQMCPFDL